MLIASGYFLSVTASGWFLEKPSGTHFPPAHLSSPSLSKIYTAFSFFLLLCAPFWKERHKTCLLQAVILRQREKAGVIETSPVGTSFASPSYCMLTPPLWSHKVLVLLATEASHPQQFSPHQPPACQETPSDISIIFLRSASLPGKRRHQTRYLFL